MHGHQCREWKLRVHLSNGLPQVRGGAARVGAGAKHYRERRHGSLQERFVDLRLVTGGLRKSLDVAYDSDDLAPFRRSARNVQANLFPEWVLVPEVVLDKFLVDHDHASPGVVVHFGEQTTAEQRNA